MNEVKDFIRKCGVFYLATIDGNVPRVRPFGIIEEFEGHLYILTGKKKNVSKQIEKNPIVEICASHGEQWLRVSGKLVRDDRIEAKKSILDNNPQLRDMYNENDDNTEVLYLENAKAIFYSFTSEPKVIEF